MHTFAWISEWLACKCRFKFVVLCTVFPRADQMCASNFTAQRNCFWSDHFPPRPAFLHNLISSDWVIFPEYLHTFLFVNESIPTFHHSFCPCTLVFIQSSFHQKKKVVENYDENYWSTKLTLVHVYRTLLKPFCQTLWTNDWWDS